MTAPQSAEQQVETLRKTLDERAARHAEVQATVKEARTILHDLNQPLTTLMGNAELLLLRADPEDPARDKYRVMVEQCDRLNKLFIKLGELIRGQDDELRDAAD